MKRFSQEVKMPAVKTRFDTVNRHHGWSMSAVTCVVSVGELCALWHNCFSISCQQLIYNHLYISALWESKGIVVWTSRLGFTMLGPYYMLCVYVCGSAGTMEPFILTTHVPTDQSRVISHFPSPFLFRPCLLCLLWAIFIHGEHGSEGGFVPLLGSNNRVLVGIFNLLYRLLYIYQSRFHPVPLYIIPLYITYQAPTNKWGPVTVVVGWDVVVKGHCPIRRWLV